MDPKDFFKLTTTKVIITLVLILLTFFVPKTTQVCSKGVNGIVCGQTEAQGLGYPLFLGTMYSGDAGVFGFSLINFLVNLVFFYLISCILVFSFNKIKVKRRKKI